MTPEQFDPQIRPIELNKDLLAVADLIETCFADNMDAEGRDYIRHVRQIARGFGSYLAEGTTPENSQLPFHGYLWVENGEAIGNLTLIQVRKIDRRTYLIANVAVRPDWRGKGIGRQLTERAISHVKEHGGSKIYLQVRVDNPIAIHIYRDLGFSETARRTTWSWSKTLQEKTETAGDIVVLKRRREEWIEQKEWLRQIYPWSLTWNLPFNMERLKPGFWNWLDVTLNGGAIRGWSAYKDRKDIGTAIWDHGFSGVDYLWLGALPDYEEDAISALLPEIFHSVSMPQRININYPAGQCVNAFLRSGMTAEHTLIWMVKNLE